MRQQSPSIGHPQPAHERLRMMDVHRVLCRPRWPDGRSAAARRAAARAGRQGRRAAHRRMHLSRGTTSTQPARSGVAAVGRQRRVRVHRRRYRASDVPEEYEKTIPLGTLAQWLAHVPNPGRWHIDRFGFKEFDSHGRRGATDIPGERTPEIEWLRANPHRLHLGASLQADSRTGRAPVPAISARCGRRSTSGRQHHEPVRSRRDG